MNPMRSMRRTLMPPGRNCQTFDNNVLTTALRPPGYEQMNRRAGYSPQCSAPGRSTNSVTVVVFAERALPFDGDSPQTTQFSRL